MKITKDMAKILLQEIKVVVRKHRATKLQNLPSYVIMDHVTGLHLVLESKLEGRKPFLDHYYATSYIQQTLSALEKGVLTEYTEQFPNRVLSDLEKAGKLGDIKADCDSILEYLKDTEAYVGKIAKIAPSIAMYKDLSNEELSVLVRYIESVDAYLIRDPYFMFFPSGSKSERILSALTGDSVSTFLNDPKNPYLNESEKRFCEYIPYILNKKELTTKRLIEFCTNISRRFNIEPTEVAREVKTLTTLLRFSQESIEYNMIKILEVQKGFESLSKIPKNKKVSAQKFYTHQKSKQAV